jgi:hypothetical protein
MQNLEYVASFDFETEPNYAYCRKLLKQGVEDSGCVDDGKLLLERVHLQELLRTIMEEINSE